MDALREGPLHIAASAGDVQEVARLVAAGAVVDAGNYRMYTPLHIAAGMAASEVVAVLLATGADAGALSTFKTTPLHEVARSGVGAAADAPLEIIDRLLAAGCPINAVDSTGRTALWYTAATGTAPWPAEQQAARCRVLQRLLDRGADPSIAARGTQGRPIDAARGLHQAKKYRIEWAQGAALLEDHGQ
ncbi:ankyrin repeat domain-containing protein [Micromonospora sp. NBC_00898]|uniref:ankyrin repeat domain-containing protein n=1 Tax=Micromonospora sp. NBC_00898 TaxID=2975981 RepID=UPI00386BA06B|nr:ankyrin repeat domain-containing protein [Micromonospora sp. NBC_00898]